MKQSYLILKNNSFVLSIKSGGGIIFLERSTLLGLIGGSALFIILLLIIISNHSSFDQKLIDQVDVGVPAQKLIPQIDEETENMKELAKVRVMAVVMDKKFWGNGDLDSPKEYEPYTTGYEFELRIINDYDTARKKYANREITRREFLNQIKGPQEFYSIYKDFRILDINYRILKPYGYA